jgi:prephenate dehydrogenase
MAQITIIGMGLIGTSIGLAIKNAKLTNIKVVGYDLDNGNARLAYKKLAIDSAEGNLRNAMRGADLVVIATPVSVIRDVLQEIGRDMPAQCAVTDTGSTKQQVLRWAEEFLPKGVSFIGGHPMAGKEASGPEAAEASLFRDKTWCLFPNRHAEDWAVEAVVNMVESTGAKPYFLDPQEHDSFVAAVSHLPIALSSALISATTKSPSWHEISRLASSGYRDVSRLASGDPTMNRDIYLTNAEEIGGWLDRAIAELLELRKALKDKNEAAIARYFATVHEERERWVAGAVHAPLAAAEVKVPGMSQQMTTFFLGDLLANKSKKLMETYEAKADGKGKRDGR